MTHLALVWSRRPEEYAKRTKLLKFQGGEPQRRARSPGLGALPTGMHAGTQALRAGGAGAGAAVLPAGLLPLASKRPEDERVHSESDTRLLTEAGPAMRAACSCCCWWWSGQLSCESITLRERKLPVVTLTQAVECFKFIGATRMPVRPPRRGASSESARSPRRDRSFPSRKKAEARAGESKRPGGYGRAPGCQWRLHQLA
jgi:hypothetical protein